MKSNSYIKIFIVLMIIGTLLLGGSGEIYSGSVPAGQLFVQTRVLPMLDYQITGELSELDIKRNDIENGFIKVPNSVMLWVKTNNINGYYISIQTMDSKFLSSIEVRTHGSSFLINNEDKGSLPVVTAQKIEDNMAEFFPGQSVEFFMPYRPWEEKHNLSFQFQLSENADVGTFPWPIVITIYPA